MIDRIKNLLGLARRAGKITAGEAQVEAMLKKGKGSLLLLAEDGGSMQKKFAFWAQTLELPMMIDGTKQEIGSALGMSPRAVALIMDQGFAKAILKARS